MKGFLAGLVIGILVPVVAAYLFLRMGGMPVATKGKPLPGERWVTRIALHAAMKDARATKAPFEPAEADFVAGAKVYATDCAACHGLPGKDPSPIAKGLFPEPPALFTKDEMVTDDPVGTIYWKAKNGIRLTGMPGFVDSLSDKELWQVSLLLQNADKLPQSATDALAGVAPTPAPAATPTPAATPAKHAKHAK